jgi:hypothetical protein
MIKQIKYFQGLVDWHVVVDLGIALGLNDGFILGVELGGLLGMALGVELGGPLGMALGSQEPTQNCPPLPRFGALGSSHAVFKNILATTVLDLSFTCHGQRF